MSIAPVSEADSPDHPLPVPVDPKKNPSYPQRTHLHEKAHWLAVLQGIESRLATPRQKMSVLGNNPERPKLERLYAQMLGARDQIAEAVKRLPRNAATCTRKITTGSKKPSPRSIAWPSSGHDPA